MKKITKLLLLCTTALLLVNCGGTELDAKNNTPFVGKIEFSAKVMGVQTGGTMTIDAGEQKVTYRIDAIKEMLGMDMVMMIDLKEMVAYSVSPKDKIYTKMDLDREDMKGELPSQKDIEEIRKEFFSKLKATGKEQTISGYTCEEYEVVGDLDGVDEGKIWVSKSFFDRIAPMWDSFSEIKELDIDDMLIGFPMKAEGKAEGKSFTFEVNKITEGKAAIADLNLTGYKELSKMKFMMKIMNDGPLDMDGLMDGLEGLDGLTENLEGLQNGDLDKLNELMENLK